ncbi:benzoate/H(+) symporter BenE family transporter [Planctobacterium marinum]|uniref:benzoate/H(+) symporter BenE family transporter n=1 Tax=Planctobacterium marinum TaxID=1631968 RepID=UPI0036120EDE
MEVLMNNTIRISHISAGFTAVLVGYTSSIVIIIQAATALGASAQQTESWLLALGLAMGLSSIGLSWYYKTPLLTAWSTPGAAMLAGASFNYEMPVILGAFVTTGAMVFLTGLIRPFRDVLQNVPPAIATAMLAAILLPFCLSSFAIAESDTLSFVLMFSGFLLAKRFVPKYAMAILLLLALIITFNGVNGFGIGLDGQGISTELAQPVWITPEFDWLAVLNLSLPLYLVTMLSQNLPGIAMLKSFQYQAPVKPVLLGTGLTNMLTAPLGGFSLNLAAISAAICMTSDVDTDPKQRYKAVLWAGLFYLLAGIFATTVVNLFLAMPGEVIKMLAGFALLGTLLMCLQSSFSDVTARESAILTFLFTLSGIQLLGLNSILWGLIVGIVHLKFMKSSD